MPQFQPFVMERMMSKFEQEVDYNLSESGVHPMLLRDLLANDRDLLQELLATDLNYPYVNGLPALRQNIARMYTGATQTNVLVTVGAIEANFITVQTLLSAGDEIVIMLPNYMQIWGLAKNMGLSIKTFRLLEEQDWAPDLSALASIVTPQTKMIAVCNPNNPTGRSLNRAESGAIVDIARDAGSWILADEVYAGAERRTDKQTPSFFGLYDKVVAMGSMSKAYGMPGLRVGWAVGPDDLIDDIWARHEYVAISATMLSNKLATLALSPEVRPRILQRTRSYIRDGFPILQDWIDRHKDLLSMTPPDAAAIAFVRYHLDINSSQLAERLRQEKSVLVVPGDHFGMDHFMRISFGLPHDYLTAALDRIHDLLAELKS